MSNARNDLEGEVFTEVADGAWVKLRGGFNLSIAKSNDFDGTIQLQKQYLEDPSETVYPVEAFTEAELPVSKRGIEYESEVVYRLACTAWTAGSARGRVSQ